MKFDKVKHWLFVNKEGIAVGTIIAVILYYMGWTLPIKIPVEGIGKLVVMILILGGIGAVIDSIYKPNK